MAISVLSPQNDQVITVGLAGLPIAVVAAAFVVGAIAWVAGGVGVASAPQALKIKPASNKTIPDNPIRRNSGRGWRLFKNLLNFILFLLYTNFLQTGFWCRLKRPL